MSEDSNDLGALKSFDTPTICNALERIDPKRKDFGYTTRNMVAINAQSGPIAGYAMTATMQSENPARRDAGQLKQERLEYYAYMFTDVDGPKICVMQDIDDAESRHGPFWGEFNTRVHRAIGFEGVVTNGCVRDVGKLPKDFLLLAHGLRPSHANLRVVSFGEPVSVFGMDVLPGDVVHADEHGAATFPSELIGEVASNAKEFVESEEPMMEACKRGNLGLDELRDLYLIRKR